MRAHTLVFSSLKEVSCERVLPIVPLFKDPLTIALHNPIVKPLNLNDNSYCYNGQSS